MNNHKENLLRDLKNHPEKYPFIAKYWDIELISKKQNHSIEFGHFGTKATNAVPFYKPLSKIIDLSKLQ
ncbi:hypothetical protein [Flavobacterium sp.]|uniref:hypothetical protein n=1 Tax=Flavobacterium sp. TaxID=239 RepID=UPI002615AA04|nr:hypothetical protein [Flavobacterium sp.]